MKENNKTIHTNSTNIFNQILNHPIATVLIIGSVTRGIANIISAAKGNTVQPALSIINTPKDKENKNSDKELA